MVEHKGPTGDLLRVVVVVGTEEMMAIKTTGRTKDPTNWTIMPVQEARKKKRRRKKKKNVWKKKENP